MKSRAGLTLIEVVIVLAVLAVVGVVLVVYLGTMRANARFAACKANISMIGKGLTIYAAANKDQWPWTVSADQWDTPTGAGRFTPPGPGTRYSVTALLFLLERDGCDGGSVFICPASGDVCDPNCKGPGFNFNWDFCPYKDPYPYEPYKGRKVEHESYSYQAPLYGNPVQRTWSDANGTFPWMSPWRSGVSANSDGNLVILADKTPSYDGQNALFNWADPGKADPRTGMSQNHNGERINLLYADLHVGESVGRADVGIGSDNIYTCADSEGSPPQPATEQGSGSGDLSNHLSPSDSFLIGPKKMDK
jgi:prepilin-type N-terminal cleavage/methylation domain-containing protein